MNASIQFLGGAGTVTGSKFLVRAQGKRILIDCGLFQGLKELRLRNWAPFPVDPKELDTVILTHAHLDHTGYLPILTRGGYAGDILCTAPTRDLSRVILLDSAKLQEEEAEHANAAGYSKHAPAKPLYTVEEAQRTLRQFKVAPRDAWQKLAEGLEFRLTHSGHILGSAFIEIRTPEFTVVFSGDLGRGDPLVLPPPSTFRHADYVVVESTYGDRVHSPLSPLRELARVVNDTLIRKGHLIIPSFAVGRTQDVLFLLSTLRRQSQIPEVPVFLDSPMGINATEIFADYPDWHRLSPGEVGDMCKSVTMIKSQQQSTELLHRKESSIVIAGSGMLSGGRVLTHLEKRLSDDRNTVLLVGFQAAGTGGSLLRSGIAELKIRGHYVPVRARIEEISTLSAHADQREIIRWLEHFESPPKKTFIVHGEPQAADALLVKIRDTLGWSCTVPKPSLEVPL